MNLDISKAWEKIDAMKNTLISIIPNLVIAVVVFACIMLTGRLVRRLIRKISRQRNKQKNVSMVLERLAHGLTFLIALFVSLSIVIPSLKAADLVNLLGIGGVAFGFAFKDILQNFLSGILILLSEPFHIGDEITTREFNGVVEDIQTRATFIRTADGQRLVIPNSQLFTDPVRVVTAYEFRRMQYDISLPLSDDSQAAKKTILRALEGVPGIETESATSVVLTSIRDGENHDRMTFKIRWWINKKQNSVELQDLVLNRICAALESPVPTPKA